MSDIQRDREERQHVIEVLKSWDGYFIGYTSDEVQEALRYAIASIETDLKYDLMYEEALEQEPTTKNDLAVDCIDRQATLDAIIKRLGIKNETYLLEAERAIYQQILAMPSVTPQEPKTGHWKDIPKYKDIAWYCSECEHFTTMKYNYCSKCGAKMVEPQESEEV